MKAIAPGEFVTKDLSELLSKHTTMKDEVLIERETQVSSSIIRKVKKGTHKITDGNIKAINRLIEVAYENISKTQTEARVSKRQLKEFLDCI